MNEGAGRALPNARVRRFMLAIQDVMGQSGLAAVLRQASLQRFANTLPPANDEPGLHAAEYAALTQAIENYYGRGARGTLLRIGYASFNRLAAAQRFTASFYQRVLRVLPMQNRQVLTLRWLASDLARPGGRVSVHLDDRRLNLVDYESDATVGRRRDSEICWVTVGEIQESLKWGTGLEYDVSELNCKAKGDAACRFEIRDPLG